MIALNEDFAAHASLCRDCMYCKPAADAESEADSYALAVCVRAPMITDLVMGGKSHPFCENERSNPSGCGRDARNFRQQPNPN